MKIPIKHLLISAQNNIETLEDPNMSVEHKKKLFRASQVILGHIRWLYDNGLTKNEEATGFNGLLGQLEKYKESKDV